MNQKPKLVGPCLSQYRWNEIGAIPRPIRWGRPPGWNYTPQLVSSPPILGVHPPDQIDKTAIPYPAIPRFGMLFVAVFRCLCRTAKPKLPRSKSSSLLYNHTCRITAKKTLEHIYSLSVFSSCLVFIQRCRGFVREFGGFCLSLNLAVLWWTGEHWW